MREIQIIDGKWYRLGNVPLHQCCSCGLVRRVDYRMERGMIFERWQVDQRETRKARKSQQKDAKRWRPKQKR